MNKIKLLYATDCHIGFELKTTGTYWAQTPWPEGSNTLFTRIAEIRQSERIDACIIGGDLIHDATRDGIRRGVAALRTIGGPVVVAFGNHDRTNQEAIAIWEEELAAEPLIFHSGKGMLSTAICDLIPVDNAWLGLDGMCHPWWDHASGCFPLPGISDDELRRLENRLLLHPEVPAIVVIHAPFWPVPPLPIQERIGKTGMTHLEQYSARLGGLLARFPRARLVLGGHIHCTTSMLFGATYLTTAALFETPHHIRRITVDGTWIDVNTVSLAHPDDPLLLRAESMALLGEPRDQELCISVRLNEVQVSNEPG